MAIQNKNPCITVMPEWLDSLKFEMAKFTFDLFKKPVLI